MIRHFTLALQETHVSKNLPTDGLYIRDITREIETCREESGISNGFVVISSLHTTLALMLNENEPGLVNHDFPNLFRRIIPEIGVFVHDDLSQRTENLDPENPERKNGHAHCRAVFLPSSITLIIENGGFVLGKWQRVLLAELDGRERTDRTLKLMFMGETYYPSC
jgi:secondary thiamine-phosphate synthase enzyme